MEEGKIFWTTILIFVVVTIILSFLTTNDAIWLGALVIVGLAGIWKISKEVGKKNPWKAFYTSALLSICLLILMTAVVSFLDQEIETLILLAMIAGTYLIGGVIGYLVAKQS